MWFYFEYKGKDYRIRIEQKKHTWYREMMDAFFFCDSYGAYYIRIDCKNDNNIFGIPFFGWSKVLRNKIDSYHEYFYTATGKTPLNTIKDKDDKDFEDILTRTGVKMVENVSKGKRIADV